MHEREREYSDKSSMNLAVSRKHNACNEEPVDIVRVDWKRRVQLSEAVQINICHNVARLTAICIFENPLQIPLKLRYLASPAPRTLTLTAEIVPFTLLVSKGNSRGNKYFRRQTQEAIIFPTPSHQPHQFSTSNSPCFKGEFKRK